MSEVILVKPSFTSNTIAEHAANEELKKSQNGETLRSFYIKLMNQLEIDGVEKTKISTIGQKIIVEKKKTIRKKAGATPEELDNIKIGRDWYDVARELNFTDPKYVHDNGAEAHRKIVPLTKHEVENADYIKVIRNTKDFLDVALNKLKYNHFMSLLDEDSKIIISLHDWQSHLDTANSYFDHKEKIPPNTQHILLHFIGTMSSNNDVAFEYFKLRAKSQQLTGKQISKYRSGEIKTKLDIFNPTNRISAILWRYIGVQCEKCNSWRVQKKSQKKDKMIVKCDDCQNIFDMASTARCNYCAFPFFDDEIAYIKKGSKCPNCKETLPEYIINNIIS